MSRKSAKNQDYQFVYGLDHAVGPFFQIYERRPPILRDGDDPDEDSPLIEADNLGVFAKASRNIPTRFKSKYYELATLFQSKRERGVSLDMDAADIASFAALCGIELPYEEIDAVLRK